MKYVSSDDLNLPPDQILRGYLYLIYQVFVFLRGTERFGDEQSELIADIGDALHNVTDLIAKYDGGWLSDEKYRRVHLQPFDARWAKHPKGGISLQGLLEEFAEEFRTHQAANDPSA
jgi:hypothetical protein